MTSITQGDLKFYKNKLKEDKDYHAKKFMERINPDKLDAYFEGDPNREEERVTNPTVGSYHVDRISQNIFFPTTQTLISRFYPQGLKFIGIPKREQDELNAKIAASALNYYYNQMRADTENEKAIISAWMYGLGTVKMGWRAIFKEMPKEPKVENNQGIGEKIKQLFTGGPKVEEEPSREYIAEEGPFLEFVSPKNIFFDKDKPTGKDRFIHQRIPKTIYEIRTNGIYDTGSDFVARMTRGGKDERETTVDLYESWIWLDDGMYLLVTVEGWEKPLRWDKSIYFAEGFPFKTLQFVNEINEKYPVSHMKAAQRQQRLRDYIYTLQKQYIEKSPDLVILNDQAFDVDDKSKIKNNEIGLRLFTKNGIPPGSAATRLGGGSVPQDLFAMGDKLESSIREILGVIGARQTGESENATLGQEQIAEFGNELRSKGMDEAIRGFLISQGKKLLQDLKQFGTLPALFKVTGLNLQDPQTGAMVTEKWIEFGTPKSPELLKDIIPQELDVDIDVSNTLGRNLPVIRKQMMEFVNGVVMPLAPVLAQQGKQFNAYKFVKKMAESFETISNADEFFDDVQLPMAQGVPGQPMPNAQPMPPTVPGIEQSAGAV